mmetsp:Transcript_27225/g.59515  ORF Transcript_27225/g.59515 Transcript_27225/m.59515 type:complete len:156 (-) Transcript_27225:474-941(-)
MAAEVPEHQVEEVDEPADSHAALNDPGTENCPPESNGGVSQAHGQEQPADQAGPSNQEREAKRARKSVAGEREASMFRRRKSLVGNGMVTDENMGVRRSTRAHMKPLEYWRNESKQYAREHRTLPTVVGIQTKTPNPDWPYTDHSKAKRRARTKG